MKRTIYPIIFAGILFFVFSFQADADPNPVQDINQTLQNVGIDISGTIEVEAAYQDTDTGDTSDITLSTVEVGIDANPVRHLSGHIVFLFEEDETDPMEIDQGYIRLDGEDLCPFYAEVGRLYLPFGRYDSHFITNPLTLELGETRETALVAGYAGALFDISVGAFNGDVNETDEEDDMIDGITAAAVYTMPRRAGLTFSAGLSYLSNVSDSNGLTDQLTTAETVTTYVPAMAAFMSADWNEAFFVKLEYVTATDHFSAGDFTFDGGQEIQPWALNVELAVAVNQQIEVAGRYGATGDAGNFLPERVYGAAVNLALMDHLGIGVEYLKGEFEDGSDTDTVTLQLAIAF